MDFPIDIPFVRAMGFELLRMQGGEAELSLQLRADQHNSMHMAHGGVTMTLLDVTMAHAARSADVPAAAPAEATGRAVITVTINPVNLHAVMERRKGGARGIGNLYDTSQNSRQTDRNWSKLAEFGQVLAENC
jgi:acyl-coenzyme A thioesterase PaaI-like protein